MTDDEIVAAYIASQEAQRAYRQAQVESLLVTDTTQYDQLVENWTPLIAFIREAHSNGESEPQPKHKVPGTLGGWHRV